MSWLLFYISICVVVAYDWDYSYPWLPTGDMLLPIIPFVGLIIDICYYCIICEIYKYICNRKCEVFSIIYGGFILRCLSRPPLLLGVEWVVIYSSPEAVVGDLAHRAIVLPP